MVFAVATNERKVEMVPFRVASFELRELTGRLWRTLPCCLISRAQHKSALKSELWHAQSQGVSKLGWITS